MFLHSPGVSFRPHTFCHNYQVIHSARGVVLLITVVPCRSVTLLHPPGEIILLLLSSLSSSSCYTFFLQTQTRPSISPRGAQNGPHVCLFYKVILASYTARTTHTHIFEYGTTHSAIGLLTKLEKKSDCFRESQVSKYPESNFVSTLDKRHKNVASDRESWEEVEHGHAMHQVDPR